MARRRHCDLHVPPLPLERFHWHKDTKTLTAEESDLRDGPRQPSDDPRLPWFVYRLYNDACDAGIAIRSHHTGEVQRFYLWQEDMHGDEIAGWRFKPEKQDSKVAEVLIIND